MKTNSRYMYRAMLCFPFILAHFSLVYYFTTCQKEESNLLQHPKSPKKPPRAKTAVQKPWKSKSLYLISSKDDAIEKGQVRLFTCQVLFCNGKTLEELTIKLKQKTEYIDSFYMSSLCFSDRYQSQAQSKLGAQLLR